MKLLLLGSGGREHALAWKIAQSPKIEKLYIAPGNAGTRNVGENVAIKADDFEAIKTFVIENSIDMVVVGPEDPLVKGVLAAYTSGNEELFMETLSRCPLARDLFEFIVAAYDAANEVTSDGDELCTDPYNTDFIGEQESVEDPVLGAVERMKNGETVELDNETMNKVCEHLAENFMNYFFRSVNGQSSLKVN